MPEERLSSPIAQAAGTTAQPGWNRPPWCESSVSSACADIALAKAASVAELDSVVPITVACATPPCVDTYSMPLRPGSSFAPETIAANESAMWCLVFSATFAGSGRSIAFAM